MVAYIRDIFISKPVIELSLYEPLTMYESNTVFEIINVMRENSIGSVLITDDMGLIVGIVSERDIVRKVLSKKLDIDSTLISEVMTKDVVTIKDKASIGKAIFYMQVDKIRHLPIVQNRSNPLGIISAKDIVDYLCKVLFKTNERFNHVKNSEVTNFLKSPVKELNFNNVICIDKKSTCKKAYKLMADNNIGSLLIKKENDELEGIISERDFLFKPEKVEDINNVETIEDLYTRYPVCLAEDESIEIALKIMSQKKIRHLPILNSDAKLSGILSVRDILAQVGESIVNDL